MFRTHRARAKLHEQKQQQFNNNNKPHLNFHRENVATKMEFSIEKATFNGRQPLMEDDLQWQMIFDGRQPSMEDNFL